MNFLRFKLLTFKLPIKKALIKFTTILYLFEAHQFPLINHEALPFYEEVKPWDF